MRAWSWTVAVLLVLVVQAGVGPSAQASTAAPTWGQPQAVPLIGGEPTSLSCPADGFCAASDDFSVSVLTGGRWQTPVDLGTSGGSSAVSCSSSSFCAVVFGDSYRLFDGSRWETARSIDNASDRRFTTVSCPATNFCVAGASNGSSAILRGRQWSSGPTVYVKPNDFLLGFMRLSCTSTTFCMALVQTDAGLGIYRLSGSAWALTLDSSSPSAFGAGDFSCVSETFCIGGGTLSGEAVRWDGSSWTTTVVDAKQPQGLVLPNGMSCVSATLCLALGTPFGDSTPGYAFQFDGMSWSARSAKSPKATPDLLSCSSARFCMALTENNVAIPVYPTSGGSGGGPEPTPVDEPPRFEAFPTKTVYPGESFVVRATDPDGDPVTLAWSALPERPVKVTCSLTSASEARCSAKAVKKAPYAPAQVMFTARAGQLFAQAPLRVSMRRFIGLGDSYSSGEGAAVKDFDDGTHFHSSTGDVGCHRSRTSWEALIGRQLVATKAVDTTAHVACSGARFTDLYNANNSWADLGEPEDPQLAAVNRDTFVATMTMGGNDVGFERILMDCTIQPLNPGGAGCRKKHRTARDSADKGLAGLRVGMSIPSTGRSRMTAADVFENVAERMADGGTLVVGGYPRLFNTQKRHYVLPAGSCAVTETDVGPIGKISREDAKWINDTVDEGNSILKKAVEDAQTRVSKFGFRTHIVFADPVPRFGNKTVCSGVKKSLINYAILRATPKPGATRQSFHPKKSGQVAYYKAFCDLVPVGKGVKTSRRCKVKEPD